MDYSTLSTEELMTLSNTIQIILNERYNEQYDVRRQKALEKVEKIIFELNRLCDQYDFRFNVVSEDENCITNYLNKCIKITNVYEKFDED